LKKLSLILFVIGFITINAQVVKQLKSKPNNAFRTGEKLTFDVDYGFISVGEAEIFIPEKKKIMFRNSFHVTFKVKSKPFFDFFFKVRDKYETYIDSAALVPWRFEQHVKEGKYQKDYGAFFNHTKNVAIHDNKEYPITDSTQDIISAFFYVRTLDFSNVKPGYTVHLQNFFNNKIYPLRVIFRGREEVEVKSGTFKCIKIEPVITDGGLFKSKGRIFIWLTDDEIKMPVKVEAEIPIGAIDAELKSYSGIYGNLSSKISD
jgi:hypothetical protein